MKPAGVAILLAMALLLAGCAGQGAPGNGSKTAINQLPAKALPGETENITQQPSMPCAQYCQSGQHAECAGAWNISGTYPDCSCGYICENQAPSNHTASGANASPDQSQDARDDLPLPAPLNATVSELLDEGMKEQESEFYSNNSGSFTERTYTWARIPMETGMDEIVFDAAPEGDVRFDNKTVTSIVASGFTLFKNNDDNTSQAYGLAIFKDKRTILDNYTSTGAFSVDYFSPMIDKKLRDCSIYARGYYQTAREEWFVSYSFICPEAYDK
jgi:hypothetical protein